MTTPSERMGARANAEGYDTIPVSFPQRLEVGDDILFAQPKISVTHEEVRCLPRTFVADHELTARLQNTQSTLKNSSSAQLITALWKRPPQELFAQLRSLEKLTSWIRRRSSSAGPASNANQVNSVAAVAAAAPQPAAPVAPASNTGPSSIPAPPWVQKMTETVPGCKGYPKVVRC